MNLYFEHPERLWLLILPLLWLVWYGWGYRRQRLVLRLSYTPTELVKLPRIWRLLHWLAPGLQVAGLVLLVLALMRPRSIEGNLPRERVGLDVLLLVDVSASMETNDLTPNRLSVARRLLSDLVRARPDDAFGMVLFAQEAFSYIPITSDHAYLQTQFAELTTEILPKEGTAIGNALAAGINRLEESGTRSPIMILFSDGVHNVGAFDPINAAYLAARRQIPVLTVGTGSVVKLPIKNLYAVGDTTDFDASTLQQIAQITGGVYFDAAREETLEQLVHELKGRQGRRSEQILFNRMYDRYHGFLVGALMCWLFAFGLARLRWFNFLEG